MESGHKMDKKRYEREIEEILKKYDEKSGRTERPKEERPPLPPPGRPGPGLPPRNRGTYRPPTSSPFSALRRLSAGQYMLSAFALAILAIFVRTFSPTLASIMVILAAVLFLLPIFLNRTPTGTPTGIPGAEQKRWRGQVIDMTTRRDITSDPFAAIKRWFRRR
jgi:hypothetical protein